MAGIQGAADGVEVVVFRLHVVDPLDHRIPDADQRRIAVGQHELDRLAFAADLQARHLTAGRNAQQVAAAGCGWFAAGAGDPLPDVQVAVAGGGDPSSGVVDPGVDAAEIEQLLLDGPRFARPARPGARVVLPGEDRGPGAPKAQRGDVDVFDECRPCRPSLAGTSVSAGAKDHGPVADGVLAADLLVLGQPHSAQRSPRQGSTAKTAFGPSSMPRKGMS